MKGCSFHLTKCVYTNYIFQILSTITLSLVLPSISCFPRFEDLYLKLLKTLESGQVQAKKEMKVTRS